MPGIVGIITKIGRAQAEPQLRCMMESLRHETFYESGVWIDESCGVYAGSVTRKGARAGALPIENEKRSKALLFSGEEYSDPGNAHH